MITTRQALQIIKLLNDMKIKENVVRTIRKVSEIEKKRKITLQKLFKLKKPEDEINDKTVTRLLEENIDIAKEIAELDSDSEEITMNLVLDFIFALGDCEEMFYKTMADITDRKVNDIKKEDVTIVVKELIDIFKSQEFMGFFKSIMK
ncbi:MAG: hypothetical protein E7A06_13130 [Clostridiales bacterium]|nr:hypothetical protein [Clostridiales bacterium]